MNNKFLKIISIAFFGLVLMAALPWIGGQIDKLKMKKTSDVSANLAGFIQESVSGILIKKGEMDRNFSYKDSKWTIDGEEADQKKMSQLFQDFSNLKIKEMVSQNEENHGKFEVTKDSGYQLTIVQNGKASTFFAGKGALAKGEFYLRKDGIKNVYVVAGDLYEKLSWEKEKWKQSN